MNTLAAIEDVLIHIRQVEGEIVLVVHRAVEGANDAREEQRGLLHVSVGRLIVSADIVGASFRIHQHSGDHRLHVSSHALAVIGKSRGDARNIRRAGIALHQMLDQLLADERSDVGMIENVIERCERSADGETRGAT